MSFKIPDSGKERVPCKELHYHKWLVENKITNIHTHETRLGYLQSLNFVLGVDMLSEADLFILRTVEQIYDECTLKSKSIKLRS